MTVIPFDPVSRIWDYLCMRGRREQIQLSGGRSLRVLRWSRAVRDVESVLAPDSAVRLAGEGDNWHYHSAMELTYFERGDGVRFVGDNIGPFAAGDVVLLGENLPHYWHARSHSAGLAAQWHFPHGHPFWSFPESLALTTLFREAERGLRFTGTAAATAADGLAALAATSGAERLGHLFSLLGRLARAPAGERQALSGRAYARPGPSAHQPAIRDAVRYLVANFREAVRLSDLLALTGLSKATFSRQFMKHAGKSYVGFLARIRLEAVCRELIETDRPITDIALDCGFGHVSFFNRLFRRHFRCSPRDYRIRKRRRERIKAGPQGSTERR
jgi:AraC-like DNA-binding protein